MGPRYFPFHSKKPENTIENFLLLVKKETSQRREKYINLKTADSIKDGGGWTVDTSSAETRLKNDGSDILLRLLGVGSHVRLWMNGKGE